MKYCNQRPIGLDSASAAVPETKHKYKILKKSAKNFKSKFQK